MKLLIKEKNMKSLLKLCVVVWSVMQVVVASDASHNLIDLTDVEAMDAALKNSMHPTKIIYNVKLDGLSRLLRVKVSDYGDAEDLLSLVTSVWEATFNTAAASNVRIQLDCLAYTTCCCDGLHVNQDTLLIQTFWKIVAKTRKDIADDKALDKLPKELFYALSPFSLIVNVTSKAACNDVATRGDAAEEKDKS